MATHTVEVDVDLDEFDIDDIADELIRNIDEVDDDKIHELKKALKTLKTEKKQAAQQYNDISQEDVSKAEFLEKVAKKYTLSYLEEKFPDCF